MKNKKLRNNILATDVRTTKPEIFSHIMSTSPNYQKVERNLDDSINFFTNKIEEMSFQFESEQAKKDYFKKKMDLLNKKMSDDNLNKDKKPLSMEFQKTVLKRLLKNTEQENRNMIDAMLEGRIASINIPSNFRGGFHSMDKSKNLKSNLPFDINTEAIKSYKKREEELKKQLRNFKQSQIFKFRLKYKKQQSKVKQEECIIETQNNSWSCLDTKESEIPNRKSNIINTNLCNQRYNFISTNAEDFVKKAKNLKYSRAGKGSNTKLSNVYINNNKTGTNFSYSLLKNNLLEKSKFTEDTTRSLQRRMNKTMTKLSKSVSTFVPKKIQNDEDKNMLEIPTHYKKAKGFFLYGEGKINGKFYDGNEGNMKKDTFDIISKIKDENAYKVKEVLNSKFGIKYNPEDLLYRKEKNNLNNEDSAYAHRVINNLIYGMTEKKIQLIKKIDSIKNSPKTELLSQKIMPKILNK